MARNAPSARVFVEFLPTIHGGRKSPIVLDGYRPHFRVGGGELLGVEFFDGPSESVQPGGSSNASVRFLYSPNVSYEPLAVGAEFEILEGPNVIGYGRVLKR